MDPYLEDPGGWGGVHDALIAVLREALNRQLGPRYIADGDTRVYVVSPDEQRWILRANFVVETPTPAIRSSGRCTVAAPVRVSLAGPATVQQPYIEEGISAADASVFVSDEEMNELWAEFGLGPEQERAAE
jgi:hypothetical protein